MSMLNLENISMVFNVKDKGKKKKLGALVNVNLEIGNSEIVAVVGESGCGKTTLGKVITGIHSPTSGKIYFDGTEIKDMSKEEFRKYRLGVQIIHQDSYAALNPNRTIFQSLSLPLLENKIAKNKEESFIILDELFKDIGLSPPDQFLSKYPHQLSGGQRQRVLLARALSVKPRLIVADEPVSMVDVSLRISLLDLMARANKKYNISFVYITHDLGTARYIARHGRIMVMYLGKVVETGLITETLGDPLHPYFKALVAAVPEISKKKSMESLPLRSFDMPNLLNLKSGCRFHPRCPHTTAICEQSEPELSSFKERSAACHRLSEIYNA
ncbi:MAG: ABC transporter ATP-binding protein [Treponema sp.]|nr:ABC transporter ATP-binding protein [Treponema sp.]